MKVTGEIALAGYRVNTPLYIVTTVADAQAVLAAGVSKVLLAFHSADTHSDLAMLVDEKSVVAEGAYKHLQPWKGTLDTLKLLGHLEGRRYGALPPLTSDMLVKQPDGTVMHAGLDKAKGAK